MKMFDLTKLDADELKKLYDKLIVSLNPLEIEMAFMVKDELAYIFKKGQTDEAK